MPLKEEAREMEGIEHRTVNVNGISMHISEMGKGSHQVVLFLHGFPELWYTWRHQIISLSSQGYHTVAPDLRGYGDTESPPLISSYTCHHIVGDIVALIDHLGVDNVFLVGHDWGAIIGWCLCLFRPDLVNAFVCLSVPFLPRNPKVKPVEGWKVSFGEDYYICRFQEPGVIEAEIEASGTENVLKKILKGRKPGPPLLPKENAFGISKGDPVALPSWFTEADLAYNVTKFNQSGFTGGLNYYRALDLNWELTAAWNNAQVKVPVKFIVGDLDSVYTTPGIKDYVQSGEFECNVPMLEEIVVMEGVGHFLNQERAEDINTHILDFIKKY